MTPVAMPNTIAKSVPRATIGSVFLIGPQRTVVTGSVLRSERPMSPWARSQR
jgi:hypothetical protein